MSDMSDSKLLLSVKEQKVLTVRTFLLSVEKIEILYKILKK